MDVFPCKCARNDYYYYFPEHVSFMCKRWFEWAAPTLGMRIERVFRYAHSTCTRVEMAKQIRGW